MRCFKGVPSSLDWRSRCCSRRPTVSLLFPESRVEMMRVRHWKEGRVVANSSINRQHVAKPRPLIHVRPSIKSSRVESYSILPVRTSDEHVAMLFVVLRMETLYHDCSDVRRKECRNFQMRNRNKTP